MRKYMSHKVVSAAHIHTFEYTAEGAIRGCHYETEYATEKFTLSADVAKRFRPTVEDNGYLVVYEDGYTSWSPSAAFEAGYTAVDDTVEDQLQDDQPVAVHVYPARDEANPYTLGVVVFGALIIGMLGVLAVVVNSPVSLFYLAVASGAAYLNYTFLHALRGGYAAWLGYDWLARLSVMSGVVSVAITLMVALNLRMLAG